MEWELGFPSLRRGPHTFFGGQGTESRKCKPWRERRTKGGEGREGKGMEGRGEGKMSVNLLKRVLAPWAGGKASWKKRDGNLQRMRTQMTGGCGVSP